jgi:hypothetical protein
MIHLYGKHRRQDTGSNRGGSHLVTSHFALTLVLVAAYLFLVHGPKLLKLQPSQQEQKLYLTWDYNEPPFTVEFEVWSKSSMTDSFALFAVVPMTGMLLTNTGTANYFIVRAKVPWDTNLVSEWNK